MSVSLLVQRKGRMFFKSLIRNSLNFDRKLETLDKVTLLIIIAFNLDKCEEIRKECIVKEAILQCFCSVQRSMKPGAACSQIALSASSFSLYLLFCVDNTVLMEFSSPACPEFLDCTVYTVLMDLRDFNIPGIKCPSCVL